MPSKNENMILGILSPNHDGKENQLVGVTEGQSYKKGEVHVYHFHTTYSFQYFFYYVEIVTVVGKLVC